MRRADLKWIAIGIAIGLWGIYSAGDWGRLTTVSLAARVTGAVIATLALVYFARWVNRRKA